MNISVIIPTHNRSKLVEKAIQSILDQTYPPKQIIVVDDGSTDNTAKLVEKYKLDYIYQKNSGVSSARNKGIAKADHQWIAFLDSDDLWEPNKLKEQVEFHQNNKDILFSHTNEIWLRDGQIQKQKIHQQKPFGKCFEQNINFCKIGPSTVMIHRSIFEDIGLFDENLTVCEDFDLWLRVLRKYEIGLIQTPLIKKVAGDHRQLSFSTFALDRFRITALEKHIDSKYKKLVKETIIKKLNYLINGAKKRDNQQILKQYIPKLRYYEDLI